MTALTVIIGLGKTGLSCVRYLAAQAKPLLVMDSRLQPPGLDSLQQDFPQVQTCLGYFDQAILDQAQEVIVSPGVSLQEPAIAQQIAQGKPVLGDIELFAREAKAPVVAVTGANGKSTVVSLLGHMVQQAGLQVQVAGNIGLPVLDTLQAVPDWYVLELSSFQLETTYSLRPVAATILNITEDHMDRYNSFAEYQAAKQRIYLNCDHIIYNRQDKHTFPIYARSAKLNSFGLDKPNSGQFGLLAKESEFWLAQGEEPWLPASELRIVGKHNWANALAALSIGTIMGLPKQAMLNAIRSFPGLAHRCEWIAASQGVAWYNDSKATNVGAALAAIEGLGETLKGKLILIAGGVGKDADFSPLAQALNQYVRAIVLVGQDAEQIARIVPASVDQLQASSLQHAVKLCKQQAKPGDAVLLAPACASFDMFANFEQRGDVFKTLVRESLA